jgi:hypothetical protein
VGLAPHGGVTTSYSFRYSSNDSGRWAGGCYVLVYPHGHTGFAAAGKTYRDEVLADTSTFRLITLEELLKHEVLHRPETASAFKERYLW